MRWKAKKGLSDVAARLAVLVTLMSSTLVLPNEYSSIGALLLCAMLPIALKNPEKFKSFFMISLMVWMPLRHVAAMPSGQPDYFSTQEKPNIPVHGFSANSVTHNLADDNSHFLVFDQLGQMASTTTYMHVMLPLNFSSVKHQITTFNRTMYRFWWAKEYYDSQGSWKAMLKSQTEHNLKQLSTRMHKLLGTVAELENILPSDEKMRSRNYRETSEFPLPPPPEGSPEAFLPIGHPHLSRHKRWIFAAVMGVVGTFMGLYSAFQIHHIANQIAETEETQDLLVHLSNHHTTALEYLSDWMSGTSAALRDYEHINPQIIYIYFNEKVMEFEQTVTKLVNIVQQLQHRRLAVDWMNKTQLEMLHSTVEDYTKKNNYLPLTKHSSDYFQLELSYFRTFDGVVALLHIPCTFASSLLTIYKYISFPIPLPHSTNHSTISVAELINPESNQKTKSSQLLNKTEALYLVAEADMIAIDVNGRYRLLTQSDLTGCIQKNHIFLCDKLNVLKTNLGETCLSSLFMKDKAGVKSNCKFEKRPLREEVFPLAGNEFLIFTPEPFTTKAVCSNGTAFRAEFSKTTKLFVPNGCKLSLKSHDISMSENVRINAPPFVTEWKWDPLTLPSDLLYEFHESPFQSKLNDSLTQIKMLSHSIDHALAKKSVNSISTTYIIFCFVIALAVFCVFLGIVHKLFKSRKSSLSEEQNKK